MDLQNGIVSAIVNEPAYLERCRTVAASARAQGMTVIYVSVRLRPGDNMVSPSNLIFTPYAQNSALSELNPSTAIHVDAGYEPDTDLLIVKRRVSAFSGSDLEILLRARAIDTLYLAGLATSGVVLSTLRQAADLDYRLFVLTDCCADSDNEVHETLISRVFIRQAALLSAAEFSAEAPV